MIKLRQFTYIAYSFSSREPSTWRGNFFINKRNNNFIGVFRLDAANLGAEDEAFETCI